MKYKQLVLTKLEQLENQIRVLKAGFRIREEFRSAEDALTENLEQIKTLINQNQEE